MKLEKCIKEGFVVIGKEGSTNDGVGFIEELWKKANSGFHEVAHLAKKEMPYIFIHHINKATIRIKYTDSLRHSVFCCAFFVVTCGLQG